jgi:hypothetical protein
LIKETDAHEAFEKSGSVESKFHKEDSNLGDLAKARINHIAEIPAHLERNNFGLSAIKKYKPFTQLVGNKINEQLPHLKDHEKS